MRVDWAAPCRFVEPYGGLATLVGVGADTIVAPAVPADVQSIFAVRIVGGEHEQGPEHDHEMVVQVMHDMTIIEELRAVFQAQRNPNATPGWEAGTITPIVARWTATEHDVYQIRFIVDDTSPRTVPIVVAPGVPEA